jgi:hypothetical protein
MSDGSEAVAAPGRRRNTVGRPRAIAGVPFAWPYRVVIAAVVLTLFFGLGCFSGSRLAFRAAGIARPRGTRKERMWASCT